MALPVETLKSVPPGKAVWNANGGFVSVLLTHLFYVCCFVRFFVNDFTPNFACRRNMVPNVSSPLLGVGGPRRAEKGGNEIFVTMGVNGEFLHFGGF